LNIDRINQRTAQKTEKSRRKLETERFAESFFRNAFIFEILLSARFEATMMNPTLQKESFAAQFGSFDYFFYYYFN
jgi:hypothetical protein